LVADRQPSAGISNFSFSSGYGCLRFFFNNFWRHITVHLCYVGGQITPHQLCNTIGYSSGRRISDRQLVFNFRFCNFNQQQCRAGGFQIPPQTQMLHVTSYAETVYGLLQFEDFSGSISLEELLDINWLKPYDKQLQFVFFDTVLFFKRDLCKHHS